MWVGTAFAICIYVSAVQQDATALILVRSVRGVTINRVLQLTERDWPCQRGRSVVATVAQRFCSA
jgi:hypothetical protein